MKLRLYDNKGNITLIEKTYPNWNKPIDKGIIESTTQIEHYLGKGLYKEIYLEGIRIGYGDIFLHKAMHLAFESDFETIEMHFALKGKSIVHTDILGKPIRFAPHQHNIIYANGICGNMQWESEQLQLCEINLAPTFFKRFFT